MQRYKYYSLQFTPNKTYHVQYWDELLVDAENIKQPTC
jgi:hypothetical protein